MAVKEINEKKASELESKLREYEDFIESSIEGAISGDEESINNGEYKYLVEDHCFQDDMPLSESLQEALDESSISLGDLIKKVINDDNFDMNYESLSSPFQYGGAEENEFYSLQWGGDKDYQIDRENVAQFIPSFSLKEEFESFSEFEEYVRYNIGYVDYLDKYWEVCVSNAQTITITYNTDYDVVRCVINDEESLIEFLKENKKPEESFVPKVLKVTKEEYVSLRNSYDGFCVKCGKVNEGNHEPDAEHYECSHCETKNSFGVEICLMNGSIEIVEDSEESTLDDSY